MAWTEERVAQLTKLWSDGLSASQIARTLGDVTRNAVIGKVHRLGLSGRAKTRTERPRISIKKKRSPKPLISIPETVKEAVLPDGSFVTVATLNENTCRWPYGDPSSSKFHFCGQRVNESSPYCEAHAQVAFQPASKRYGSRKNVVTPLERVRESGETAAEPASAPQKRAVG